MTSWITQQLETNPRFVQGWNSALWEIAKLAMDHPTLEGRELLEFCRDLAQEAPSHD